MRERVNTYDLALGGEESWGVVIDVGGTSYEGVRANALAYCAQHRLGEPTSIVISNETEIQGDHEQGPCTIVWRVSMGGERPSEEEQ